MLARLVSSANVGAAAESDMDNAVAASFLFIQEFLQR
jgi:hypothetical protein